MQRLRQRAEFLAAAKGERAQGPAFVLQARHRGDEAAPRFGFTVSRKVGTAVERNRVRRRLRDMVRRAKTQRLKPGHDYVLVARRNVLTRPFAALIEDFDGALRRLGRPAKRPPPHESRQ